MPSLVLGATTSDKVDFGANTAFDTMAKFSVGILAKPTTFTDQRAYFGKRPAGAGWELDVFGTSGDLRFTMVRGTTSADYRTNTTPVVLNAWNGIIVTVDTTVSPQVVIWVWRNGALTKPTFGTQTDGAGTQPGDAAGNFLAGNIVAVTTRALQGNVEHLMLWPGVIVNGGQAADWFTAPRSLEGACRYWDLGADGLGPQRDRQHGDTSGTVTGATIAESVPRTLVVPRVRRQWA